MTSFSKLGFFFHFTLFYLICRWILYVQDIPPGFRRNLAQIKWNASSETERETETKPMSVKETKPIEGE